MTTGNEQPIRVGGAGTGRIFQHAHQRAYPAFLPDARLVGFFDVVQARAEQACDGYRQRLEEHAAAHPRLADAVQANLAELQVHDSLGSLIEQVDIVDICTHARGRMPTAIAAFERDTSAMSEKPMARTWTEVARAMRVKQQHPAAHFALNDDNAFEPKYRLIHDTITQGEIGKVQHITMIRGSHLGAKSVLKAQATGLENGGGCLMDYGTHGLAGAMTLFGPAYRPVRVEAVGIATLYPHRVLEDDPFLMEVDDNARVKILFEHERTGSWATLFIEATYCGGHISLAQPKPGGQSGGVLEIIGDRGSITTAADDSFTINYYSGGRVEVPCLVYAGETISVRDEMGSFFAAYRQGRDGPLDLAAGASIIATCGAAYLSQVRGGSAVTLDELYELCAGFVDQHGDNAAADDAIVTALLAPYAAGDR